MEKKIIQPEKIIIEPESKATACVIWLHGLGANGHDFVDIIPELKLPRILKIRFIFPHAPVRPVTINANMPMRAWYDIYTLSNLDHEDKAGILKSTAAIETLIQDELNKGLVSQQIILAGFSQGGAIALYAGLRYSKPLAGILVLSAYLPLASSLAKEAHTANKTTPIFMGYGEYDDVLPIRLGETTRDFLHQLNYSVEWHNYPMGHQVCQQEIADIAKWLIGLRHTSD